MLRMLFCKSHSKSNVSCLMSHMGGFIEMNTMYFTYFIQRIIADIKLLSDFELFALFVEPNQIDVLKLCSFCWWVTFHLINYIFHYPMISDIRIVINFSVNVSVRTYNSKMLSHFFFLQLIFSFTKYIESVQVKPIYLTRYQVNADDSSFDRNLVAWIKY